MTEQAAPGETILNSIRRIVRALRVSSRAAEKDLGVSGTQLFLLQKLREGGMLSINELAERTFTHQSSVSALVSRLIERGLVARSLSSEDRRKRNVALTRLGGELMAGAPASPQAKLLDGIALLAGREQRQLASLLVRLLQGAGLSEVPATLFFEKIPHHACA